MYFNKNNETLFLFHKVFNTSFTKLYELQQNATNYTSNRSIAKSYEKFLIFTLIVIIVLFIRFLFSKIKY